MEAAEEACVKHPGVTSDGACSGLLEPAEEACVKHPCMTSDGTGSVLLEQTDPVLYFSRTSSERAKKQF